MSLMAIIAWIVIGAIAGWLAGVVMRGGGYGLLGDIVVGIVGGFIGGFVLGLFGIEAQASFVGSIITAFIGAVILIVVVRAVAPRRSTL